MMGLEIIGATAVIVLCLRWLVQWTDRSDENDNDRWWGDR